MRAPAAHHLVSLPLSALLSKQQIAMTLHFQPGSSGCFPVRTPAYVTRDSPCIFSIPRRLRHWKAQSMEGLTTKLLSCVFVAQPLRCHGGLACLPAIPGLWIKYDCPPPLTLTSEAWAGLQLSDTEGRVAVSICLNSSVMAATLEEGRLSWEERDEIRQKKKITSAEKPGNKPKTETHL